jgi:uncharacterized membrane protein YeaQ/YmgE (transglycosylase-associated protein family)
VLVAVLFVCIVLFVALPLVGATLGSLLPTLLVGLVLGAIARVIAPGRGPMGCLFTSLVGVAGSLLGTVAARSLHIGHFGRLLLQIGAAVVLVVLLRPTRSSARGGRT